MVLNFTKFIFIIYFLGNVCLAEIFQQEQIEVNHIRFSLTAGKEKNQLPYFEVKNSAAANKINFQLGKSVEDAFIYESSIGFKKISQNDLEVVFIVIAAAPGGSDTAFAINLFKFNKQGVVLLNNPAWILMVEDGFYIGKINKQNELGAVTWEFIFGENESHVSKHRYKISFYKFTNNQLVLTKSIITKNKYSEGQEALKEMNLNFENQLYDFHQFDEYR